MNIPLTLGRPALEQSYSFWTANNNFSAENISWFWLGRVTISTTLIILLQQCILKGFILRLHFFRRFIIMRVAFEKKKISLIKLFSVLLYLASLINYP